MRILVIILLLLHSQLLQGMEQKMILSAHLKTKDAAKDLYSIDKFFETDDRARSLQSKYNLTFQMELLSPYVAVTIKPIRSLALKNNLYYILQEKFPQIFVVDTSSIEDTIASKTMPAVTQKKKEKMQRDSMPIVKDVPMVDKIKLFWNELEGEWIGLLFLALAGFLLTYRSARQISKIKRLQKEVEKYQGKIEDDIEMLGDKHV